MKLDSFVLPGPPALLVLIFLCIAVTACARTQVQDTAPEAHAERAVATACDGDDAGPDETKSLVPGGARHPVDEKPEPEITSKTAQPELFWHFVRYQRVRIHESDRQRFDAFQQDFVIASHCHFTRELTDDSKTIKTLINPAQADVLPPGDFEITDDNRNPFSNWGSYLGGGTQDFCPIGGECPGS